MPRRSPSSSLTCILLSLLLGVVGCAPAAAPPSAPIVLDQVGAIASSALDGSIDAAIDAQGIDSFVDLRDGRRTDIGYRSVFWIQGSVDPEAVDEWSERYEIVGERVVGGVAYRVEEWTDPQDPGSVPHLESLYRQDRSGLYLWQEDAGPIARNVIAAQPRRGTIDVGRVESALAARGLDAVAVRAYVRAAARIAARLEALERGGPPGGVGASEITFLRYPLRPGRSWVGRVGFNVWTVEGREVLDTPIGRMGTWRMNIVLPRYFGPEDRYVTWWAAPGEVKRRWHAEALATDEYGNPIGTMIFDQEAELLDYRPGS
jgi:hypothetical protein